MNIFDQAKSLAQQAEEKIDQAEELLNLAGGVLPPDKKEQAENFLQQAEQVLHSIPGLDTAAPKDTSPTDNRPLAIRVDEAIKAAKLEGATFYVATAGGKVVLKGTASAATLEEAQTIASNVAGATEVDATEVTISS